MKTPSFITGLWAILPSGSCSRYRGKSQRAGADPARRRPEGILLFQIPREVSLSWGTMRRNFVHPMHKVPRENHFITKPLRPSTDGAAKLQRQVSSGSSHRCSVVQRIYRFLRAPRIVPRHITMMPSGIFFKVQEMGYPDRLILLLGRRYDE